MAPIKLQNKILLCLIEQHLVNLYGSVEVWHNAILVCTRV